MTQAALLARSSDYATPPWGDEKQARFVNACIEIETSLDPHALLFTLHKIEKKFGRDRAQETRWGPRTLDLDLIAYDDCQIDKPELTLPHPRLFERAFVLVPLAEIAPDRVIAGRSVKRGAGTGSRPTVSSGYPISADRKRPKQPFGLAAAPWQFPANGVRPRAKETTCRMTTTDDLRLAADFAPATYDDWRKLVDGVLKGAPFEKLVGKTSDGLRIDPIYRRAAGATPIAGRAAAAPWQIMQRIDHPDAGASQRAGAARSRKWRHRPRARIRRRPRRPRLWSRDATAETLARVFDGVFLDAGIAIALNPCSRRGMAARTFRRYHRSAMFRSRQRRSSLQLSAAQRHRRARRRGPYLGGDVKSRLPA